MKTKQKEKFGEIPSQIMGVFEGKKRKKRKKKKKKKEEIENGRRKRKKKKKKKEKEEKEERREKREKRKKREKKEENFLTFSFKKTTRLKILEKKLKTQPNFVCFFSDWLCC